MSARPLHILYVAPFGLRHKTTVWARTLPLARHIVERGMQCTILVPPWDSPEDSGLAQNVDGVALVQVNVQGGLPAIIIRLMQEIALRKPDIVHCVKPRAHAGIVQWLLWQRRRLGKSTPRIFLDLDDWEQAWQPVNHYPPTTAAFLAWQEEWGIRHADAISVASRWLENRAREYAPQTPILYLPNGVEIAAAEPVVSAISPNSEPAPEASSAPDEQHAEIGVTTREDIPRLTGDGSILWFTRFVEVDPGWFAAFATALFAANPDARLIIAGTPLHTDGDQTYRSALPAEYADCVAWLGFIPPARVAALTGLAEGTPLCVGAHDQNCSTLGGGGVAAGTAVMVIGTFGSCYVVSDKPLRDPLSTLTVKPNHGVGNWTIEGFSATAASSFRWYRDVFADLEVAAGRVLKRDPYDLITQAVSEVPPGANGITFLPHLQGAAGARPNLNAKGTFTGMTLATSKSDMARAVLEGIGFEMRDVLEAQAKAGVEVRSVRLVGGAAKSPMWCQLLADVFERPVELLQTSETGCLGAALYAGTAAGVYPDVAAAVDRAVSVTDTYEPDGSVAPQYEKAFRRYQAVFDALTDTVFTPDS